MWMFICNLKCFEKPLANSLMWAWLNSDCFGLIRVNGRHFGILVLESESIQIHLECPFSPKHCIHVGRMLQRPEQTFFA